MPKTGIRPYETKTKGLRWLAYYYRDSRQVLKRGFRTSRQAERWRADALVSVESPADTTLTVGEWMSEWLERHRVHIGPSTRQRYESSLRNWIIPHIGMVRLTALTHRHIEEMHGAAIRVGRSPQTVRRNHMPLNTALKDAVRDELIADNPASQVRLPRLRKKDIDTFTQQEADGFLNGNLKHELYPVYNLALYSGLRLGEIMALRVGRDIDLVGQSVAVREKRRKGVIGPPKSRESARIVILAPEAMEVLAKTIADKYEGGLVFPGNPDTVTRSMAAACKRAGVKRIRFHDLRHTHATLLLAKGANIKAVSARLGHASASFTLDVYGHVLPGMDGELAQQTRTLFSNTINILSQTSTNSIVEALLAPE